MCFFLQVREADFHKDPHLREFGISVSTAMTAVEGRVLKAPELECKDKRKVGNTNQIVVVL